MKDKCCRREFIQASAGLAAVAATVRQGHAQAQGKDEEDTTISAELGSADKLADQSPHLLKAEFKNTEGTIIETEKVFARWVKINNITGRWIVVSAICQHLKCKVEYHPAHSRYVCPCHGSEYDINGNKVKGPSKRDLPDYSEQVLVEDGVLKLIREAPVTT